jgi:transposase
MKSDGAKPIQASVRRKARLSKAGNARLRKALFLPTQTAVRFNSLLRGLFARLVAAGKPKMQAIGVCMRKLVMLCYGVLKNRARFAPDWVSRKAPDNTLPG